MCGKRSRSPRSFLVSLCFLALLLSAPATLAAEDPATQTSPPSEPSTTSGQQSPTPSWSNLDQLLTTLEAEAKLSSSESAELLIELKNSQTEASALQRSLALSEQSLTALEQSTQAERQAAVKALETALREAQAARQRAERWKLGAIIAGALAAVGWGVAAFQYVF